jgi:phosphoglycolate phosphatase/pyrophosphatase PpaX
MNTKTIQQIKHLCFDLDGTLMDSYRTIFNCTEKTLNDLNIPYSLQDNEFKKRIGHHFREIFTELNIPVTDIEKFISTYKKNYFDFIDDSELYDGIISFLDECLLHGIKVSLLTTKAQDQAEKILEHFAISKYFSVIMGRRNGFKIKPDPEPLIYICNELKIPPENTLIIGDTELDILCGKNAGTLTGAVTYGYRSKDELVKYIPDFLINNPGELRTILPLK